MCDRLIELIKQADDKCGHTSCGECGRFGTEDDCLIGLIADYLIENGVIVPPVKVGDEVWFELYGQIEPAVVYHCTYELSRRGCLLSGAYAKDARGMELTFEANSIGKGVFLSREEAEQALKGERHG